MGEDDQHQDRKAEATGTGTTVRRRVLLHLRSLLLPGAVGLAACKSSVVCDPMPPPSDAQTSTTGGTAPVDTSTAPVVCDPMPPPTMNSPLPSATATAPPTAPPPVVCDPMPPPPPEPKK